MSNKTPEAYKTIGEVTKLLGLVNNKNGSLQTHTIRFWEKEFKQINPIIRAGNRRYYSQKNFQTIKMIKYLLKDQGLTIKGAKKVLSQKNLKDLDAKVVFSVNNQSIDTKFIKEKLLKISNKIKDLKRTNNG